MQYWLTADLHLGHENIIKYCKRPFKSLDDMNTTLVRRWNERIKPEDMVLVNGDFCFRNTSGGKRGEGIITTATQWEQQLNGKIIHIVGNHDRNNSVKSRIKSLQFRFSHYDINIVHNPQRIDYRYNIHLVGHIHTLWKAQVQYIYGKPVYIINVGVDVWNFYPQNMEEIMNYLQTLQKEYRYKYKKLYKNEEGVCSWITN